MGTFESGIVKAVSNGWLVQFPIDLVDKATNERITVLKPFLANNLDDVIKLLDNFLVSPEEVNKNM